MAITSNETGEVIQVFPVSQLAEPLAKGDVLGRANQLDEAFIAYGDLANRDLPRHGTERLVIAFARYSQAELARTNILRGTPRDGNGYDYDDADVIETFGVDDLRPNATENVLAYLLQRGRALQDLAGLLALDGHEGWPQFASLINRLRIAQGHLWWALQDTERAVPPPELPNSEDPDYQIKAAPIIARQKILEAARARRIGEKLSTIDPNLGHIIALGEAVLDRAHGDFSTISPRQRKFFRDEVLPLLQTPHLIAHDLVVFVTGREI